MTTTTVTAETNLATDLWHKLELFTEGAPDEVFDIPSDEKFLEESLNFLPAGETIGRFYKTLLFNFTEFDFLEKAHIKLLWKLKGGKSSGNEILGRLQKPTGLLWHFSQCDYVVWFAADHCRSRQFTNWQMTALLYHELKYAAQDDNGNFAVRGHEFEGFVDEIKLFGAWKDSMKPIIYAARKLPGFE